MKEAQKSITICTTENGLQRLSVHTKELKDAIERGVDVRIAGMMTHENRDEVQSLLFCNVRQISNVPANFFSFDGKKSLIVDAQPDDESIIYGRDVGFWVSNPALTSFLDTALLTKFSRTKEIKKE